MKTDISNADLTTDTTVFRIDGDDYITLDVAESTTNLYRVESKTTNVRALHTADAVLYDGQVLEPAVDDIGRIVLVHNWAGNRHAFLPHEWLETPAWKLSRIRPQYHE